MKNKRKILLKTLRKTHSYPIECSLVAGSQAENAEDNYLYVMKWSKLHRLKDEDDSDYDSDEDDDEDDDPEMHSMQIKHPHTVNRIRAMPQGKIVSTFSEDGKVYMWNIGQEYDAVEKGQVRFLKFRREIEFSC